MAKKVRMEDADRISNLPDAVISHILSFLPTREAVRTSILSTRWRYLFSLLTNINFTWFEGNASFVDRMMFVHNTRSIEKFRLEDVTDIDSSRLCGWISAAVWRGVHHLDLFISRRGFATLPGILYTCGTLVTLKLNIDFVLNVPKYVCFPNLKTLHLRSVQFSDDDSVKRLISSCNCLEDMTIEECAMDKISNFSISNHSLKRLTIDHPGGYYSSFSNFWIEIDAPMLVYFNYSSYELAGYSLKNLNSLATAEIEFFLFDDSLTYNHNQFAATLFFRGICKVQSLNLSLTSMKLLSSCGSVPDFPNMVQLSIFDEYPQEFIQWEGIGLATLMGSTPELEKLTFCQQVFSYLPEKVPSCLLFKLKDVEILEFEAGKPCIEKAKYFLENAGVLEKLTIDTRLCVTKWEKKKILEEMLASRKSKQCCILII